MGFRRTYDRRWMIAAFAAIFSLTGFFLTVPAVAPAAAQERPIPYSSNEIIVSGHKFFGSISKGLAEVVEAATKQWGKPNGYILGQEAGGAFVGGLRYGEGVLYTRNAGDKRVFWQGPSIGFDAGGDGDRTMILVYNLPAKEAVFQRFAGVDGSSSWCRSAPASAPGSVSTSAISNSPTGPLGIRSSLGTRSRLGTLTPFAWDRGAWHNDRNARPLLA